MATITFTVTNDLVHDRRMQRICRSLTDAGFNVTLIGRRYDNSPELPPFPFQTVRLKHFFRSGKLFYLEYQIRLLFHLLRSRHDMYCAIDLDSIIPVSIAGWIYRAHRIFDAHEHFTEVPELTGRPLARWIWSRIGKTCIPRMDLAYTVGPALADVLHNEYDFPFGVIRNLPVKQFATDLPSREARILWYHGALNMGRGLEVTIRAMEYLPDYEFWIAGEGDLSASLRELTKSLDLEKRVKFLGWVAPSELMHYAARSSIGLNLLDATSQSYFYSLANKAFDYIQARLPAVHMHFPEYEQLQKAGPVGILVPELTVRALVQAVRDLEANAYYRTCQNGCERLAQHLTWEEEEKTLLNWYRELATLHRVRE